MQSKKLAILYSIILATVMLGTVALVAFAPAGIIKANVAWEPKTFTWDGPPPSPWNAKIWLTGGHKGDEIDTSTIKLEGLYSPINTGTIVHGKLIIGFDPLDVKTALGDKLPHMNPGVFRIALVITGKLLTGEDWSGDGTITVTIPQPPPP